jgi:hypothetical protein
VAILGSRETCRLFWQVVFAANKPLANKRLKRENWSHGREQRVTPVVEEEIAADRPGRNQAMGPPMAHCV